MSEFKAVHVERGARIKIQGPASRVFPLLCPVREAYWAPGWEAAVLYSQSGYAEKGCVFTSRHPGEPDTIWLITEHDPEAAVVRFSRVTPGIKLADLLIKVFENGEAGCEMEVAYTWTALSEEGNRDLSELTAEEYAREMDFWQAAINHYLKTGQTMPMP